MRAFLLSIMLASASSPVAAQQLVVGVDPRVELLSIVFRLAGAAEYNQAELPAYAAAVDSHFAQFRDHDVVTLARQLRLTRGIGYDAVMSFAVHVTPPPALAERVPFDTPGLALAARWPSSDARAFADALRRFVVDANFAGFIDAHRTLHDSASARLRVLVERRIDPAWFDRFFGARAGDRFVLVPGLLNGSGSFGPRVAPQGGPEELWAIIGTWTRDSAGVPTFPDSRAHTVAHEFAHSFVNPVVARHAAAFAPFAPGCAAVADIMREQAYTCWKTVVDESIVRATAVVWARANGPAVEARAAERSEVARGFYWTVELADSMAAWRATRRADESWEDGVERTASWFRSLRDRVPAMRAAFDARRPVVVAQSIADGAVDVDPATHRLSVTFSQPMARGWSLQRLGGNDGVMPTFTNPRISADSMQFEVDMTLAPGTAYAFALNGPFGGSFRNADGVPLARVAVRFATSGGAARP